MDQMLCKDVYFLALVVFHQNRTIGQFCQRALYETSVGNYFEFGPGDVALKYLYIWSSGGHLVWGSNTI